MEPITPKLLNKRSAHSAYIKHTQEEAAVLRDLVDHIKANYPLDSACKYTKLIQELLSKISKTCPRINNSGEQLVTVTPKNKDKRIRFTEPCRLNCPLVFGLRLALAYDWRCSQLTYFFSKFWGNGARRNPQTKSEDTNQGKTLSVLHMDLLVDQWRVARVNEKKYILDISSDLRKPSGSIRKIRECSLFNQQLREYYEKRELGKVTTEGDIGIFIGYAPTKKAFWIYNRRTRRIIETIHVDFDELTIMASEHSSSGPALHEMTPATISLRLVPNPSLSTPFVPPSRTDWDMLFQPLLDELLNPPPSVDFLTPEVIAPIDEVVAPEPVVSTSTPSSTTVDQDAPSLSNSQSTPETPPPIIPNDVEEDNHDIEVAHMGNDPYFDIQIPEVSSDQSSSSDIIHSIVPPDHQVSKHNSKWTKDHPLENIIGELNRPVSTRLQLHEQALLYYYDAFLTAVEPKTYKDALTQACWIEAMQEELNEFERLEVWELVPRPDKVKVITLKWIYKMKLDELGGILKNKAQLVARGYRQEEGIDFEQSLLRLQD
ncbi:retrovirus-related pol polyprotein from transposon TNT 1-94 [Tanacetum coccineum]